MNALGKHVIAELYDCNREVINNETIVEKFMTNAVKLSGATLVKSIFHKFSPHGVTGIIVVAESHFAIHTWPEYGYSAIDIFTCGEIIDNRIALDYLKDKLSAKSMSILEMKRGQIDLEKELSHKPNGSWQ